MSQDSQESQSCYYRELKTLDGMVRNDVVPYYRNFILIGKKRRVPGSEIFRINQMIIKKWSIPALTYIKEKAWKGISL